MIRSRRGVYVQGNHNESIAQGATRGVHEVMRGRREGSRRFKSKSIIPHRLFEVVAAYIVRKHSKQRTKSVSAGNGLQPTYLQAKPLRERELPSRPLWPVKLAMGRRRRGKEGKVGGRKGPAVWACLLNRLIPSDLKGKGGHVGLTCIHSPEILSVKATGVNRE